MDQMLQNRIQNLIGEEMPMPQQYAEGGGVEPGPVSQFELDSVEGLDNEETMMSLEQAAGQPSNPNADLEEAISQLTMARDQSTDEDEIAYIDGLVNAAEVGSNAPMADLAMELSQAGRGGDVTLAHLRAGEIVLPPETMDDPEFEAMVERRFEQIGLDPRAAVVGMGIASLNPITGLEEFGWFSKSWKSVKKVAKKVIEPIAKVAQFIPGPWQIPAALYTKAMTVYNVAKGRASPLALASLMSPLPGGSAVGAAGSAAGSAASGGIGSLFSKAGEFVTKGADGVGLLGNIGKGIGSIGSSIGSGIGKVGEFALKGSDGVGLLGNIGQGIGSVGDYVFEGDTAGNLFTNLRKDVFGTYTDAQASAELSKMAGAGNISEEMISGLMEQGLSPQQVLKSVSGVTDPLMTAGTTMSSADTAASLGLPKDVAKLLEQAGAVPESHYDAAGYKKSLIDQAGALYKQYEDAGTLPTALANASGADTGGRFFGKKTPAWIKAIEDIAKGTGKAVTGGIGSIFGGGGGGGGFNLGGLGGVAAAGLLGKLAYDEAKNQKGVALTPLTQEGSTGRYNIEAEIARRTGEPAPNPVEFGLLPAGTMPTLSGGRKAPVAARYGGAIMSARYGGPVMPMAYAKGGNVAVEEFERKNGGIAGEGTETSDDVPAMLSDGEFVMTGQAVRGAGAFDLTKGDSGIVTLTPNGGENRDGGTALMYEMMDLFAEFADKPKSNRKKAA